MKNDWHKLATAIGCVIAMLILAWLLSGCSGGSNTPTRVREYHTGWPQNVNYNPGFEGSGCNACHVSEITWGKLIPGWVHDPAYVNMDWKQ